MTVKLARAAVFAGVLGLTTQVPAPARAGLGSVTVSETGGTYNFTITNAEITTPAGSKPANLSGVASPFNYKVNFIQNAPSLNKITATDSYYFFRATLANTNNDFLQSLNGATGFLTGTLDLDRTLTSSLKVYDSGLIELDIIADTVGGPPPPGTSCWTGLNIVGATGSGCTTYLNTLSLTFNTGVQNKVSTGSNPITINALLANFEGSYSGAGYFSSGGGESKLNYAVTNTAVPAPAPLFGAAAAFNISRRIRRRIRLHHAVSGTSGS